MILAFKRGREDTIDKKKQHPGPKERHVGGQLVWRAGQNVVDAKDLVIHQAFHKVELAPATEHRPKKRSWRAGCIRQTGSAKKPVTAHAGQQINAEMEVAILSGLYLDLIKRKGLAMRRHADQVMPLEDLVQDDAVKETAQTQAEDATSDEDRM